MDSLRCLFCLAAMLILLAGRDPALSQALPETPMPIVPESTIREEDLIEEAMPPPVVAPGTMAPTSKKAPTAYGDSPQEKIGVPKFEFRISGTDPAPSQAEAAPVETAPLEVEDPSLTARIRPDTLPRQAASLRLAEEGRKLLGTGEPQKALSRLERAIALDSRNPYAYYYLAQAHYHLSQYRESLGFLDIVEAALSQEPLWLARVYALEGENYRALGFFDLADRKYLKALALLPSHRIALEGLSYFPREIISPGR